MLKFQSYTKSFGSCSQCEKNIRVAFEKTEWWGRDSEEEGSSRKSIQKFRRTDEEQFLTSKVRDRKDTKRHRKSNQRHHQKERRLGQNAITGLTIIERRWRTSENFIERNGQDGREKRSIPAGILTNTYKWKACSDLQSIPKKSKID